VTQIPPLLNPTHILINTTGFGLDTIYLVKETLSSTYINKEYSYISKGKVKTGKTLNAQSML